MSSSKRSRVTVSRASNPVPIAALSVEDKRACGSCTFCCTWISILVLKKPTAVDCALLKDGGCSVYGSHPHECVKFKCGWLMGAFNKDDRPDKIGAVFWANQDAADRGQAHFVVRLDSERRMAKGRARKLIMQVSRKFQVKVSHAAQRGWVVFRELIRREGDHDLIHNEMIKAGALFTPEQHAEAIKPYIQESKS